MGVLHRGVQDTLDPRILLEVMIRTELSLRQ